MTIIVVLLMGYFALRLFLQIRRLFAPSRPADALKFADPGRSPEEVAEWLRNLPDEAEDDTEPLDESGPRPR